MRKTCLVTLLMACLLTCNKAPEPPAAARSSSPAPSASALSAPELTQPTQSRWQLNDKFPPHAKGAKVVAQIHALSENFTEIYPSMLIACEKTSAALFLRPEDVNGFERGLTEARLDYTIDDERPVGIKGNVNLSAGVVTLGGLPLIRRLFTAKRFSVGYHILGQPDPAPLYFSVDGSIEMKDRLRQLCPNVPF